MECEQLSRLFRRCHGSTLKDYAAKIALDVRQLYELRRRLVRKSLNCLQDLCHSPPKDPLASDNC
jgi:hypothetical protein